MSVVDVHPEHLLDREAEGTLSADERAHLDAHLARCAACRLERMVRADFAAELGGGEGPSVHDLVSGALIAARVPAEIPAAQYEAPPEPAPRRRSRAFFLVFAATLLVGSGLALAQTELGARVVVLARETLGLAAPKLPEKAPPPPVRKPRRKAPEKVAVASAPDLAPEITLKGDTTQASPSEVNEAVTESSLPGPRHAREGRARSGRPTRARSVRAPAAVAPAPVAPAPVAEPTAPAAPEPRAVAPIATPAGLFERANAARRAGRRLEASALYRELGARFGESPEARLSLVLLARLQLDGGEAEAALHGFDDYLSGADGALREQALVGRVEALRRLGRHAEEGEALDELLRRYPDSPYGKLAKERREKRGD